MGKGGEGGKRGWNTLPLQAHTLSLVRSTNIQSMAQCVNLSFQILKKIGCEFHMKRRVETPLNPPCNNVIHTLHAYTHTLTVFFNDC